MYFKFENGTRVRWYLKCLLNCLKWSILGNSWWSRPTLIVLYSGESVYFRIWQICQIKVFHLLFLARYIQSMNFDFSRNFWAENRPLRPLSFACETTYSYLNQLLTNPGLIPIKWKNVRFVPVYLQLFSQS